MLDLIEQHRRQLNKLCRKYRVGALHIMGSATRNDFDPAKSDLDFVVEFPDLVVADAADRFLGLLVDLEELFGRPVDLISYRAIRNPYFKQVVDRTRVMLYAA